MEHDDNLSKIENTLVTSDPNEFTVKEAEHLNICIQGRIKQIQTEIDNVESKIKLLGVFEPSSDRTGDRDRDQVIKEEYKSLKIQENLLKSQVVNLLSSSSLLEDVTLELKSLISKFNNIKESVKDCLILEEAPNPNKKIRLNFANEKINNGCQSLLLDQNSNSPNTTVADFEKEEIVENNLSQDELELIFKQSFITTTDLLNFRCVNSTWRDAATSILLIRDSCQLNLELKSVPDDSESDQNKKQKVVYCRNHPFNIFPLMDLLPIIRASRKFPTTTLKIHGKSTVCSALVSIFYNQVELLQFFTLYGKFIRSIYIGILISKKELEDLLLHYTPNLECLKFKSLECISDKIDGSLFSQSKLTDEACSSLKVISTGPCTPFGIESEYCSANLKALLDAASNLQCIKNVPLELSEILLEQQKVHLIKELIFTPCYDDPETIKMTKNLATMSPKLSVLKVIFGKINENNCAPVISALNSLLKSSKDTLESFEIAINLFNFPRKIKIPILKNLKCIKFIESLKSFGNPFGIVGRQDPIFEFPEAKSGHELFPKLHRVKVDSVKTFDVDRSLMRFFPYYLPLNEDGSLTDNCVLSVKALEISLRKWPPIESVLPVSRLFPNIRSLTLEIDCAFGKTFQNFIWLICPLAEFVEIIVGRRCNREDQKIESATVDSFFTGFPLELCLSLQREESPLNYSTDKKIIEFLRAMRSICDLQYLKFLEVRFFQLTSPFISTVSCLYAFKQMPELNVTFKCDPTVGMSDRKKMRRCLSDVAEYVNVDIDTTLDGIILNHSSIAEKDLEEDVQIIIDNSGSSFSSSDSDDSDDDMDFIGE